MDERKVVVFNVLKIYLKLFCEYLIFGYSRIFCYLELERSLVLVVGKEEGINIC